MLFQIIISSIFSMAASLYDGQEYYDEELNMRIEKALVEAGI